MFLLLAAAVGDIYAAVIVTRREWHLVANMRTVSVLHSYLNTSRLIACVYKYMMQYPRIHKHSDKVQLLFQTGCQRCNCKVTAPSLGITIIIDATCTNGKSLNKLQ